MIKEESIQEEDITFVNIYAVYTQHRNTSVYKANTNRHKGGN